MSKGEGIFIDAEIVSLIKECFLSEELSDSSKLIVVCSLLFPAQPSKAALDWAESVMTNKAGDIKSTPYKEFRARALNNSDDSDNQID